jgi:hypothetical protein
MPHSPVAVIARSSMSAGTFGFTHVAFGFFTATVRDDLRTAIGSSFVRRARAVSRKIPFRACPHRPATSLRAAPDRSPSASQGEPARNRALNIVDLCLSLWPSGNASQRALTQRPQSPSRTLRNELLDHRHPGAVYKENARQRRLGLAVERLCAPATVSRADRSHRRSVDRMRSTSCDPNVRCPCLLGAPKTGEAVGVATITSSIIIASRTGSAFAASTVLLKRFAQS